jgi:hypothetical protein
MQYFVLLIYLWRVLGGRRRRLEGGADRVRDRSAPAALPQPKTTPLKIL